MNEPTSVPQAQSKPSLRRAITGPMLFLFILGDVLGAGVYALAGTIAGEVGGAIWVPLLVALFFAMLTAGSYAELVTKYPHAGAASVFAEKAFKSPLISFLVGFSMLAAAVNSAAGLSLAFAGDYLAAFIDVSPSVAALVFLVMIAMLNARGVKESLGANVVMTVIEVSGLLLVIVAAGWFFRSGEAHFGRALERQSRAWSAQRGIAGVLLICRLRDVGQSGRGNSTRAYGLPRRTVCCADHGGNCVHGGLESPRPWCCRWKNWRGLRRRCLKL